MAALRPTGKVVADALSGLHKAPADAAQSPAVVGTVVRWPAPDGSHVCAFEVEHRANGEPLVFACRRGCGRSILNMVAELRAQLLAANTKVTQLENLPCR